MSPRRALLGAGASALVMLAMAIATVAAWAEPGPITLASTNGLEQADRAESPALAADGRYLAFAGQIGGLGGIFRKDLTTGEVAAVLGKPEVAGASDASAPSISADGRFVSFTTGESIDPVDDPTAGTSDVYLADMSNSPPTYTLVSARDESTLGLSYEGVGGSVASSRVAISADGNEVVFVTTAASDLTGAPGAHETPALQVAVRNLATRRTILISAARDPASGAPLASTPVAGGAVYSNPRLLSGAAISADGSTVSWIGIHVPLQAAVAAAEAPGIAAQESGSYQYTEPLWRRIPTPLDPTPQTRRMVSAGLFPDVVSGQNGKLLTNCQETKGWDLYASALLEVTPSLSADGDEVAVIGQPAAYVDAYLFDLAGEPTVRQLTRAVPPAALREGACEADTQPFRVGSGSIAGLSVSPAGDRVALTTTRQRFPLTPPTLVGSPPSLVALPELYLADLSLGTLQRLTHGATETEPSLLLTTQESFQNEFGATSVSFDANGETLAFASHASNLVPGDGNGNGDGPGSDAFLVSDPRSAPDPGTNVISPRPPSLRTTPRRILTARATSRPDGSVRVAVSVPGAGRLQAVAKTNGGKGVKPRPIASARRRARLASTFAFSLTPKRQFRHRVRAKGGVEAELRLQFRGTGTGAGGAPLRLLLHVRFHAHPKKKESRR